MKKITTFLLFLLAACQCYSQTAEEYFNRGAAKFDLQDYSRAIVDFTKVIELSPDYADAYFIRAVAKKELYDYPGAIADHTYAIQLNPDFAEAKSLFKFCSIKVLW